MSLNIVVPTRNEQDGIAAFIDELEQHVPTGTRVLFVDDSDDDTVAVVTEMALRYSGLLDIVVIHRPVGQRHNKLAGAVTLGVEHAEPGLVLIMDADLQHPPETIKSMVAAADHADLVVASRYCDGGSAEGLDGPLRYAVSRMCTGLARVLFPYALRSVSDPMTGFFLFRKDKVDTSLLQTSGFKILLEVLARHPHLTRTEVPMSFAPRRHGASNADFDNGKKFLAQLWRLHVARTSMVARRAVFAQSRSA